MEFQRRGAPHFHLMLFDAPFIDRSWLSLAWFRCVGSWDWKHLKAGTNIEGVHGAGETARVVAYVSKYMAKVYVRQSTSGSDTIGRVWGIWNKGRNETTTIEIDRSLAAHLYTFVCYRMEGRRDYIPREWDHCTIYGDRIGSDDFRSRIVDALETLYRAGER
jgi:hypothetical protein